jgi:hypothetical protein
MLWLISAYLLVGIGMAIYLYPTIGGNLIARSVVAGLIVPLWVPLLVVVGIMLVAIVMRRWIDRIEGRP